MSSRGAKLGRQVEEDVSRFDDIWRDGARRPWKNRNDDDLSHKNQVRVGDCRVGSDQTLQSNLEVLGNGSEGVAGDNNVEAWTAEDGSGSCLGGLGLAGGVVWDADLGGDGEDLACRYEVDVGDLVCCRDVADSAVEFGGDGT